MRTVSWGLGVACLASTLGVAAGPPPPEPSWAPRVWLHAHNCYPDEGRGTDRLSRALAATRGTVAIEQDVAWDARRGQSVVSHDPELDGTEPTLEAHFFGALSARLDEELAARRTATWPLVVLHLDFKSNEPEHHAAIWALLGRYQRWLTTAPRVDAAAEPQPLSIGPVLVLTEQGRGQERTFQLPPLDESFVGRRRGGRSAGGRGVDGGRCATPHSPRRAGARTWALDPVLHAQRASSERRGLVRWLQLRLARHRAAALAGRHRRGRGLRRHRSVRGVQRPAFGHSVVTWTDPTPDNTTGRRRVKVHSRPCASAP